MEAFKRMFLLFLLINVCVEIRDLSKNRWMQTDHRGWACRRSSPPLNEVSSPLRASLQFPLIFRSILQTSAWLLSDSESPDNWKRWEREIRVPFTPFFIFFVTHPPFSLFLLLIFLAVCPDFILHLLFLPLWPLPSPPAALSLSLGYDYSISAFPSACSEMKNGSLTHLSRLFVCSCAIETGWVKKINDRKMCSCGTSSACVLIDVVEVCVDGISK